MSDLEAMIRFEQRFSLLREIIARYRIRLQEMEREVVELFAANQLSAIADCMSEKHRIEALIYRLEQFIAQWESSAVAGIAHDRHENT
ncbi:MULTISPECIES: hypothetical protein [Brevibacillus]|jgi:hypothetical protein|uniref:Coniferyl aldehyde dehydrogenase n=2 Tax=Brevibacillus TaxID=55080 RepID=A0AA48M8Z7_9BACL|nr:MULTISPECIES: hypothetical protein [Brevibacillus]REK61665.1 MAG: hypothetical protein DF221_14660 [Brevibacillus sp.]UFJ61349.1 hypothetical protein IRT44_00235 [Anoxybacillus sediminis]MBR8660250.1 hypothetical protein [Brevibacillus sp. NL20B1]MDT3416709.1 hypothetical protein [Brevibacillus aydinogluensis]NNV04087.1 hypothetical protein [Brevibacillus sp. MCWH]